MAAEYSGTRLYLGNLPKDTRRQEIEDFFNENGHGTITEVKLMDGFGFIQYESSDDAKDIVPTFHGKEFKGSNLIVQFARGNRHHNNPRDFPPGGPGGFPPRPRRTQFRMNITGLPPDTSWQDLKDFARKSNDSVVFSDMSRDRDGRGTVEFETLEDLKRACSFLDQSDYRGSRVTCVADEGAIAGGSGGGRYAGGNGGGYSGPRGRSVSPHRGSYGRRYSPQPPRNHSPPRYGSRSSRYESPPHRSYRERSPQARGGREPYYGGGSGRERSPPPRRPLPPVDDYPPARGGAPYNGREDYPPPRRGYGDADYHSHNSTNGRSRYDDSRRYPPSPPPPRGGARSPPPARGAPPPRGGYDEYDDRRRGEPDSFDGIPTGPKSHRSNNNGGGFRGRSQPE